MEQRDLELFHVFCRPIRIEMDRVGPERQCTVAEQKSPVSGRMMRVKSSLPRCSGFFCVRGGLHGRRVGDFFMKTRLRTSRMLVSSSLESRFLTASSDSPSSAQADLALHGDESQRVLSVGFL